MVVTAERRDSRTGVMAKRRIPSHPREFRDRRPNQWPLVRATGLSGNSAGTMAATRGPSLMHPSLPTLLRVGFFPSRPSAHIPRDAAPPTPSGSALLALLMARPGSLIQLGSNSESPRSDARDLVRVTVRVVALLEDSVLVFGRNSVKLESLRCRKEPRLVGPHAFLRATGLPPPSSGPARRCAVHSSRSAAPDRTPISPWRLAPPVPKRLSSPMARTKRCKRRSRREPRLVAGTHRLPLARVGSRTKRPEAASAIPEPRRTKQLSDDAAPKLAGSVPARVPPPVPSATSAGPTSAAIARTTERESPDRSTFTIIPQANTGARPPTVRGA